MDDRTKFAIQTALDTSRTLINTSLGFSAAAIAIVKMSSEITYTASLLLYIVAAAFLLSCFCGGLLSAKLTGAVAKEQNLTSETIYEGSASAFAGGQFVLWGLALFAFIVSAAAALWAI